MYDLTKEFKSFFKEVGGNEGDRCNYVTRLDSYGCGCLHDCQYCYAKSLLSFRNLWNPLKLSVADIKYITKVIKKLYQNRFKGVLRLGGMTDCFQPLEKTKRITYQIIKRLNYCKIPYLIVTKSALVADSEYIKLMDQELAHIQISLTSTDPVISKRIEKASLPQQRIKAIETLQAKGFDVAVRLSPFISNFYDYDKLNNISCDKCLIEFLRVNHWIKKWLEIDVSDYTLRHANYLHLPLEEKKKCLEKITGYKQRSVCEDVPEHHAYWQEHFNYNPKDCCNLKIN